MKHPMTGVRRCSWWTQRNKTCVHLRSFADPKFLNSALLSRLYHAVFMFDVVFKLIAVMLEETAYRHRRRIAQRTDSPALDLAGNIIELVEIGHGALAFYDARQHTV